jgi:excisionase family DNA binding protein
VIAEVVNSDITADQMLVHAEQAMHRAKHAGRNRVEKVDVSARSFSVLAAAKYLGITPDEVLDLVHHGRLVPTEHERTLRFDRDAVEEYRQSIKSQESKIKID